MKSRTRKLSNLLKGLVWYGDYYIFKLFRLFHTKRLPRNIRNILVIELLYIGDILVITPILRALKQRFPGAKITVMVYPEMKDVLAGNPNVDIIITYTEKELKTNRIADDLRDKYDLAVILRPGPYISSSWLISRLLYRARIPYRIGSTRVGFLEGRGFFLHGKTKPCLRLKHKIEDHLDVVRTIKADTKDKYLEAYTTKEAENYIKEILAKNNITKKDFLVVIHAAPQHRSHRWLDEGWIELANKLIRKYKAKIVFSGSRKDFEFNENLISKTKAVNLAGTTIKQFFALIKRADLVVSVDTSAMHVAAAFDKPVVALFGAGNPRIWRPYCKEGLVIYKNNVCTSCMKHRCKLKGKKYMECMKAIKVEDVLNAVEQLRK